MASPGNSSTYDLHGPGGRERVLARGEPHETTDPVGEPTFVAELSRVVENYIRIADQGEDERRKSDRIGANLYAGRHWDVRVPRDRAALTIPYSKTLINQLISLQTKQDPIWVVAPNDAGDREAARVMQQLLPKIWTEDGMQRKVRRALRLGETTRTCAAKTLWDDSLRGGAGDVTTDIIPGWRLILDPRASHPEEMRFIGDRAMMSRTDAMLLYPEAAEIIENAGSPVSASALGGGTADSPIRDQFKSQSATGSGSVAWGTAGAIVNGVPVVTAFTGRTPVGYADEYAVHVVELYHRDYTMHEEDVPMLDGDGNPKRKMLREDDGTPRFTQDGPWDEILGEPGYKLSFEDQTERKLVRMYPQWRRTTKIYPEGRVIEDIAWDHPQPYELYQAGEWLEGPWSKGTIHDLLDSQIVLNVSTSIMQDNLRYGSYRVFKRTSDCPATRNSLLFQAGQVLDVGRAINNLEPLTFPEISTAWFGWRQEIKKDMREIAGVDGIMSGSMADVAPRADSSKMTDSLAELGGSKIVEKTQNMETFIIGIGRRVGYWVAKNYTDAHAIAVENAEGELTWERASRELLMGSFRYDIVIGSTTAWSGSGTRNRILEELQLGLRDKVSAWKALDSTAYAVADWRDVLRRNPQSNSIAPPARTRAAAPKPPSPTKSKK
jgi:hypothetical protein